MRARMRQGTHLTLATHQQHRDPTSVDTFHLALYQLSVGQHWHELLRHLLRSGVIHPNLLAENQMATEISRRARNSIAEHSKAQSGVSFFLPSKDQRSHVKGGCTGVEQIGRASRRER